MSTTTPHLAFADDLRWGGIGNILLTNVPDTITVGQYTLLRKSELHITLLAGKFLAPLLDSQNEMHARELLRDDLLAFTKDHDLTQFTLTGDYYLVEQEECVTIIAMVTVPVVEPFFDFLRDKYGVAFPTQPTHITLYTLQPDAGIWLTSSEDLDRYGQKITPKELAKTTIQSA